MAKLKVQGNASGTGVVTLTAPNTNTDRTITLPDGDISLGVGIDDNATSTAITIDASENVLVGKTASGYSSTGVENRNTGLITSVVNDADCMVLNRQTSDGSIVQFRKDNTTVGSIGTAGGQFNIGSNTTAGLQFANSVIYPRGTGNTVQNGTIDLGNATNRFKDLYLSGGVYLGGTGAANKLDDYETGTWTPTVLTGAASLTIVYAKYTKIGKQVTVVYYVSGFTSLTTSQIKLGGLPYTVDNNGYAVNMFGNDTYPGYLRARSNTTEIWAYRINPSTGLRTNITGVEMGTGHMLGTLTYLTA